MNWLTNLILRRAPIELKVLPGAVKVEVKVEFAGDVSGITLENKNGERRGENGTEKRDAT